MNTSRFLTLGSTVMALSSLSCALLNQLPANLNALDLKPPTIAFQGATLVRAPSQAQLAAHYCPEVVSLPLGAAGPLCQGFFGARPSPAAMAAVFDLHFRVSNPNKIPVPLASVLAGVTLYPTTGSQRLGAVCVQLCPEGQAGCSGQPGPGACQASSRDVRSLSDFAGAAANFLMANGIAAATGQPVSFVAPKISQASQLDVTVRYMLSPQDLLAAMKQLAVQSVGELKSGRRISFAIPYRIEGTVWFDVGSLGRIAVGFGPAQGTWVLPT
jgi:hypothetical protein